ncbi:hypothetical protein TSUD_115450 [Trifolium subterraneum]|uniref:Uncharacterized protein n=1 Tax=Trifolium subterraneum TaxID=3900 RepID=A0A2Z6MI69_TRISU|nr:hypothetical protein TSUD_115450 [Trifolium subterraneum]
MHEQTQPMPSVDGESLEQHEPMPSVDGGPLEQTQPMHEQTQPMPSVDGESLEQHEPMPSVDEQTEPLSSVVGEPFEQTEPMPSVDDEPSEQTEPMPSVNEPSSKLNLCLLMMVFNLHPIRRLRQRQLRPIVGDQPNGEGRRRQRKRQRQSDEVQHVHNLREVIDEASLPEHTEPLCTMREPSYTEPLCTMREPLHTEPLNNDNNDPSMGEDSISVDGSSMMLVARVRGFDGEGPIIITVDDLIDTTVAHVITLLNNTFSLPSNFNSWGYTDSGRFHLINNLDTDSLTNIIKIPGIVFEAIDEDYSVPMTYFLNRLSDDSCRNKVQQGINFILASSKSNQKLVKKEDNNGISYAIQNRRHHPNNILFAGFSLPGGFFCFLAAL